MNSTERGVAEVELCRESEPVRYWGRGGRHCQRGNYMCIYVEMQQSLFRSRILFGAIDIYGKDFKCSLRLEGRVCQRRKYN